MSYLLTYLQPLFLTCISTIKVVVFIFFLLNILICRILSGKLRIYSGMGKPNLYPIQTTKLGLKHIMNVRCSNEKWYNAGAEMHSNFSDRRISIASEEQIVYSSKLPKSSVYIVTPCVCEF